MIEDLELRLRGFDVGEKQVQGLNKALDVLEKIAAKADAKLKLVETDVGDKLPKSTKAAALSLDQLGKSFEGVTNKIQRTNTASKELAAGYGKTTSALERVIASLKTQAEKTGEALGVGAVGGQVGLAAGLAYVGVQAGKAVFNFAEAGAKAKDAERAFYGLGGTTAQLAQAMQNLGGTVSEDYLRRQFNLAKTLGISSDQFAQLTKVAKVAAAALGKDVGEALNDVTVAVARQSKLILDNIGITFSIEDANEKYARSIGKTAGALTDAEKQQAFFNATMAAAQPLLDKINTDAAADKYGRLSAAVADAAGSVRMLADSILSLPAGWAADALGAVGSSAVMQNGRFEIGRRQAIAQMEAEQAGYGDMVRGGLANLQRWARSGAPMGPANGSPEQIAARDEAEARARARARAAGHGRRGRGTLDDLVAGNLWGPIDTGPSEGGYSFDEPRDYDRAAFAGTLFNQAFDREETAERRARGRATSAAQARADKKLDGGLGAQVGGQFKQLADDATNYAGMITGAATQMSGAIGQMWTDLILSGGEGSRSFKQHVGDMLAGISAQAFGYATLLGGMALAAALAPTLAAVFGVTAPQLAAGAAIMGATGLALAGTARALGAGGGGASAAPGGRSGGGGGGGSRAIAPGPAQAPRAERRSEGGPTTYVFHQHFLGRPLLDQRDIGDAAARGLNAGQRAAGAARQRGR